LRRFALCAGLCTSLCCIAFCEGLSIEEVWPVGESRDYAYVVRGVEVGVQRNRMVEKLPGKRGPVYRMEHTLELDTEAAARLLAVEGEVPALKEADAYCLVDEGGFPLFYEIALTLGESRQDISVTFEEQRATAIIEGADSKKRIRLRYQRVPNVIEVNFIGSLNLLLVGKPLEVGRAFRCYLLAPMALRTFNARAVIEREETIEWAGERVRTFVVEVADEIAWITPDGRILRLSIPEMGIEAELIPEDRPAEDVSADEAPGAAEGDCPH